MKNACWKSKCFRCFIRILQIFHMDVAKVDRDAAYVATVVYVCCKLLFQIYLDVAYVFTTVSSVANFCSQCFIYFPNIRCKCVYLDVAYVSHIRCKCFI
jgi:hypothetical protein